VSGAAAEPPRVPPAWADVVRRRRMTRAFRPDPVPGSLVDELIELAGRSPAAGNTAGLRFVVLDRPAQVEGYWSVTLPAGRRAAFPWPGLLAAPVLLVACVSAEAYAARYAEADKRRRPAASEDARRALADTWGWAVPYWYVDGGMAVMSLLLAAEAAGLGALFFGLFEHEAGVRALLRIPDAWQPLGTVALGWADAGGTQRSRSVTGHPRPGLEELRYGGAWPSSHSR
jgi:nitroreductase